MLTEQFLPHFEAVSSACSLKQVRMRAWEKLADCKVPSGLPALTLPPQPSDPTKEQIARQVPEGCRHSFLTFCNGTFLPECSDTTALPSALVILPLGEAMRSYSHFLRHRFSCILEEERDALALLNLAVHQSGVFLFVPPDVNVQTPLACVQLAHEHATASLLAVRLHLVLGVHSQLTLLCAEQSQGALHAAFDLMLEEGAELQLFGVQRTRTACWSGETLRAQLKRASSLRSVHCTSGAHHVKRDVRVRLLQEEAQADMAGLWVLEEKRRAETCVLVRHEAPRTRSRQKFKGVVDGVSQSHFVGKILIERQAQQSDAYLKNDNLLLGQHARASSMPELEIFADDVKASHGATCASMDPSQLFYLTSRGVAPAYASELLTSGFCREVTDHLPPSMRFYG